MREQQTLGRRIQEGRRAAGLSQESLGERLGVSRQAVSKWESDASVPDLENLIAMSRIFGVTIGALLGVEPETAEEPSAEEAPEASGGESGDAAPDKGLTDRELAAVEAIVQKYLEAARRPRWSRRRKVLAGAAICAVLALAVCALSSSFFSLENRLDQVQSQVYGIERSVGNQIGSLTGQISGLLAEQNSLISGYDIRVTDYDLEQQMWYLAATVTPKEYTADTVVTFTARTDTGATASAQARNEGGVFTAENWAVPMASMPARTDEGVPLDNGGVQISVSLTGGGTIRTQTLEEYLYLDLTDYRLEVDGRWETKWASGQLTLGNLDLKIENNTELPVALADAELALFCHGEEEPLWSAPLEDAVELWRRQGYVQMYVPVEADVSPVRMNTGDALLAAVHVTDDHGQDYWSFVGCWRNRNGALYQDSLYDLNDRYAGNWQPGDLLPIWN